MNVPSKSILLTGLFPIFLLLSGSSIPRLSPPSISADKPTTWSEKLGFPAGKKIIILHADDIGMCSEANVAAKHYLEAGAIQSAAVMMPCEAAADMITWARQNPSFDVGLHLSLTSEWRTYRWGSVSGSPSLVDDDQKLWRDVMSVVTHASPTEVESEIRAQIERSISLGYRPDHIDTHMGSLYGHLELMKVFFKVAEDYHIPANVIDLSDPEVLAHYRREGYPLDDDAVKLIGQYSLPKLDFFTSVPTGPSYEEKVENFKNLIQQLKPGLTEIIFHPSVETENFKTILYSWEQRVWEAKMFSDPDLVQFLKDEGIIFTNWKEVMDRFANKK